MEVLLVSPFHPFLVILAKGVPYLVLSLFNLTGHSLAERISPRYADQWKRAFIIFRKHIIDYYSFIIRIADFKCHRFTADGHVVFLMGMLLPTMLFTDLCSRWKTCRRPLQIIANVVPAKWYYIIVKAIMIKGLGFWGIWKETLILVGMTVFLLLLSFKKFKLRLA
jgi:ABC-2 type transport system permease protein